MTADLITKGAAEIARIKCRQAAARRIKTAPNPYKDGTIERQVWDSEIQRLADRVRMQA